ncbi:hypothetical protein [Chryseobacterium sp. EO14]|uniref:hypothetical protein n=1 Tax=Chryseobacterium sp. EO14 TaxID=2950551 RepID=UPI00210CB39E|nr:hypothetical protein [Chryseobacterium sp. EO14]MCQ4139855.1 hypothetical protein [Chryseobacterium sp. EO14]
MKNKNLKLRTVSAFIVILLTACNKEPQHERKNSLEQNYPSNNISSSETKSPEQWKKEAELYLKMQEGDTVALYNTEHQQNIQQENVKEQGYKPFVDVKAIEESERLKQQNRRIIKTKYYIENKDHTWRRVSKKEYYGY